MYCLLRKRAFFFFPLIISMMIVFTTIDQKNVLAGKNVHSFYLPSVLKQATDVQPREILFAVKYPGDIKVDASWEPGERELTITIYDQEGKSLVSKKDESPVHLVYTYTQEHFNKARFLGSTFRVGISQSPFKTINGSVIIITPGKKVIQEDDSINTRGPYGTFIEEEKEEESEN